MGRPRIRTLKPELWQDEAVGSLGPWERLLYVGLITMADDDGRLRAMPAAIAGHCFPYENPAPSRIKKWLGSIEGASLIECYTVSTVPYVEIVGWLDHQKIDHAKPGGLPSPLDISVKRR